MGEPVKKPILGVGRFTGLNREYSVEYSISSVSAKRREYGARGRHSSSSSGARG
jgi:hypothetical protein